MTGEKFVRWWPPVGLVLMALLGWGVGKASTPVDDVFQDAGRAGEAYRTAFGDPACLKMILDWRSRS